MHITLIPDILFHIGTFPVTNAILAGWVASAIIIGIVIVLRRKIQLIPGGFQNVFEFIVESFLNLIEEVFGGDKSSARRFFPYIFTAFLFILVANWIGLIPGVGSVLFDNGHESVPLLRSATSDLNLTFALATISVILIQTMGILTLGFFRYGKRFLNLKSPIGFFVGIIEFIGEISKYVAFSFRLFGNIFGGKVIILVMISLIPYVMPVPFYAFELFVGLIQAIIFALLTAIFIRIATIDMTEAH